MNIRSWFRWGPDPEVKAFVADLNGVQYSSYTNQRMWLRFVNVLIASYIWALLTNNVDLLNAALPFIGVIATALTGKSVVTAASRYGKSKTAVPYVEAKERGKASATPQTVVEAKDRTTVNAGDDAVAAANGPRPKENSDEDEEHRWRGDRPTEGLG